MPNVTQSDIVTGLSRLGISPGDTVMVHSSLSAFGHVDGGAPTVISAMLETLGEDGTLVLPTFSNYLHGEERVWDRENTPSSVGIISETGRTWPGAIRSNHACHPLAAIGPNAELMCRTPHKTGFGPDSPFKTLVDINAWILMMGTTYNTCTLFHLLEAAVTVPYRFLEERKATIIIDGAADPDGSAWEYTRDLGATNDFMVLGNELEARGLVSIGKIGQAEQRLFRAGDVYTVGMEKMQQDPLYLLTDDTKINWR